MSDDDQKPRLNTEHMKALMDSIDEHAKSMQALGQAAEESAFHMMMTSPGNLPPILKCAGMGRWGFEPFPPGPEPTRIIPFIHGVQVVTNEHLPPDQVLLLGRLDRGGNLDQMQMPPLHFEAKEYLEDMNPLDGMPSASFNALLQATHRTLTNNNRGYFNTIICVDDSPIIPEQPRKCWTCSGVFMARTTTRQCDPCKAEWERKQRRLMFDLHMVSIKIFWRSIREFERAWNIDPYTTEHAPAPPFLTAKQTRERIATAKKVRRRQKIKARKLSRLSNPST